MCKLDKAFLWQGRDDWEDGAAGRRWHHKAHQPDQQPGVALVGLASDLGVQANKGRTGARQGPKTIRAALANFAWHANTSLWDAGDIVATEDLDGAQKAYARLVSENLQQHKLVIGLGGGHEIAWGSYLGLFESVQNKDRANIGIINFDAHFDLRKPAPLASSGTPFRQIAEHCQGLGMAFSYCCLGIAETANTQALFDYANQSGCRYLLDRDCQLAHTKAMLTPFLQQIDQLYVTVCLDAFPPDVAPGVSAPSTLGISLEFVLDTIDWLAKSQADLNYSWRLADIAEMNPSYDLDQRTAKLAARLVYEIVKAQNR